MAKKEKALPRRKRLSRWIEMSNMIHDLLKDQEFEGMTAEEIFRKCEPAAKLVQDEKDRQYWYTLCIKQMYSVGKAFHEDLLDEIRKSV